MHDSTLLRCFTCGAEKPVDEFQRDINNRTGFKGNCKACLKAYKLQYKTANAGKVKASDARYRAENRAKVRVAQQKYKRENTDQEAAYRVRTRFEAIARAYRAKWKANGDGGNVTGADLRRVWAEYCGLCVYCLDPAEQFDHVVPFKAGGPNVLENIVTSCRFCNDSKKDKPLLIWMAARRLAA